jgi:hypothetical protein
MNREIKVRLDPVAIVVVALAMLTALNTRAAAFDMQATGSSPSPESYLAGYPAPQPGAPPVIETAQATQLQNLQPGYVPQPPLR